MTLGNFNDDYAPRGVQTEIGVGFDAVRWHMATDSSGPTTGFKRAVLAAGQ